MRRVSRPYKQQGYYRQSYQTLVPPTVITTPGSPGIPPSFPAFTGSPFGGGPNPLDPINEAFQSFLQQIIGKTQDTWNAFCDHYKLGCAIKGKGLPQSAQDFQKKQQEDFNKALGQLPGQIGNVLVGGGTGVPGFGCLCKTKPNCNAQAFGSCKKCCCTAQCAKLSAGRWMNPRVSSDNKWCYCNFSKDANDQCRKQCAAKYPNRNGSPKAVGNTCYCNLQSQASQCKGLCEKKYPNRSMSPRVSGNTCYCNLAPIQSADARCSSLCKSKYPGRGMKPEAIGNTCYCNLSFKCPYSGCTGSDTQMGCYTCYCKKRCKDKGYPGMDHVKSDGSCYCNPKVTTGGGGGSISTGQRCIQLVPSCKSASNPCWCRCKKICGSRRPQMKADGSCKCY